MLDVSPESRESISGVVNHPSVGDGEYSGIIEALRGLRGDYDSPDNSWIKEMAPAIEIIDILSPELSYPDEVKEIVGHIGAPEFFGSNFPDIEAVLGTVRKVEAVFEPYVEPRGDQPPAAESVEGPEIEAIPVTDEEAGRVSSALPDAFDDPKEIYEFWKDKLLNIDLDEDGSVVDVVSEEFTSAEDANRFLVEELAQDVPINAVLDSENQLPFEQIMATLNDLGDTISRIEQGLEEKDFRDVFISDELPVHHVNLVELIREISSGETAGDSPIEGLTITDEKKEKKKEEAGSVSTLGGDFLSQIRKSISEPREEDSYKERYKKALAEATRAGEDEPSRLVFHPLFASLAASAGDSKSGKIFKEVRVPQGPGGELVGIEFNTAGTVRFSDVVSAIESNIKHLKKNAYSGIRGLGRQNLTDYSEARAESIREADDLFEAIKGWDEENQAFKDEYEAEGINASEFDDYSLRKLMVDESSSLFIESIELIQHLVFPYLFSENLYDIPRERRGDEAYKKLYVSTYISQIKRKFKNYFEKKIRHKYGRDFLCFGMSRDIGRDYINLIVKNTLDPYAYVGRRYVGCPMCNKKIYYNKYTKRLGDDDSFDDVESYSDYNYQRYSIFRTHNRGVISEDMLNDPGTQDGKYHSNTYEGRKSWSEIQDLISSDKKAGHHEGMIRRGEALRSLGAKKIGTTPTQVAQVRYKCPFSAEKMPSGWEKEDTESLNISSQCGLSFDTSLFDGDAGSIRVENLQYSASEDGSDSGASFMSALDSAVEDGKLDQEKREEFVRYFERMRSGGWKFSRMFFACPCHVEVPGTGLLEGIPSEYKKYKYLAVPHAGPLNSAKQGSASYSPPTSPDGTGASFEEGRSTYLVCGATTSLSSFNRDPKHAQSMARLFKNLMVQYRGDLSNAKLHTAALVNTLIRYGVDFEDILPFVRYMADPDKIIEALTKEERMTKIANILVSAMAMDLRGGVEENRWIEGGRIELLNDVGLVCHHGHKFTIGQSTRFGASHAGFDLSSKTGTHTWHSVERANLLTTRGEDNFSSVLSSNIIQKLRADEVESYQQYSDWSAAGIKKKKIRDLLVRGYGENDMYAFNSDQGHIKKYIWGYENSDREAFDPHIAPDRRTFQRTMIRAVESESNEMFDADGGVIGVTHQDKRDFQQWREGLSGADSEGLDGAQKISASVRFLNNTLKNYLQNIVSWLDVGTSMEVQDVLTNKERICCEDSEIESIKDSVYDMVFLVEGAGLMSGLSSGSSFPNDVVNEFDQKVLSRFKNKDITFLRNFSGYNKYSVSNLISSGFLSLLNAALEASGEGEIQIQNNKDAISDIIAGSRELGSIVDILVPDVIAHEQIFSGTGSASEKKVMVALRRSEYTGRLIMVSSAMYLADSISRIYRMSMDKDLNPRGYIGFDIGLDLSSANKILELSYEDVDSMVDDVQSIMLAQEEMSEGDRFNPKMSKHQYNAFKVNMEGVFEDLIAEASRVRAASMSHPYLVRASEYIKSIMSGKLDSADEADAVAINNIMDHILGSIPIVDVSLHKDDKYSRYAASATTNYNYAPTYRASIATYRGDDRSGLNWAARTAMFLLSSSKEIFDTHGLGIGLSDDPERYYVLAKVSRDGAIVTSPPHGIVLDDETKKLPEEVRRVGWSVVSVPEHNYDPKPQTNVSVASHPYTYIKDGEMRNDLSGMRSSGGMHIGRLHPGGTREKSIPPCRYMFDSPVGLIIPYDLSGSLNPPAAGGVTRNVVSPVGKTVPKKETGSSAMGVRPPVVEIKAPINIGTANEEVIRDMAPFLQRHPESANKILSDIDKKYFDYLGARRDLGSLSNANSEERSYIFKSLGVSSEEVKNKLVRDSQYRREYDKTLRSKYIDIISDLHKQYRSLPYHVESKMTRTYQNGATASGIGSGSDEPPSYWPVTAPYVPMLDWVTINHMISSDQYGPEFGGHGMWNVNDSSDVQALVKACMVNFLISVYDLDVLAASINRHLKKIGEVESIDVDDILNMNSLIRKIGEKNMKKIFGYDISWTKSSGGSSVYWADAGDKKDIYKEMDRKASSLDREFGDWHSSIGHMYYIDGGRDRRMSENSDGETVAIDPGAYIRVWGDVNPINVKTLKPEDRFAEAQSYDTDTRLRFGDIESTRVVHGTVPFKYDAGAHNIYSYSTKLSSLLFDDINRAKDEHLQHMESMSIGDTSEASYNSGEYFNKFAQRRNLLDRIILRARAESLLSLLK